MAFLLQFPCTVPYGRMNVLFWQDHNLIASLESLVDELLEEQIAKVEGVWVGEDVAGHPFAHFLILEVDMVLLNDVVVEAASVGEKVGGDWEEGGADQRLPVAANLCTISMQIIMRILELPLYSPTSMSGFHFSSPVEPQAQTMVFPLAPSPVTFLFSA